MATAGIGSPAGSGPGPPCLASTISSRPRQLSGQNMPDRSIPDQHPVPRCQPTLGPPPSVTRADPSRSDHPGCARPATLSPRPADPPRRSEPPIPPGTDPGARGGGARARRGAPSHRRSAARDRGAASTPGSTRAGRGWVQGASPDGPCHRVRNAARTDVAHADPAYPRGPPPGRASLDGRPSERSP